jgi:hypothetical protein
MVMYPLPRLFFACEFVNQGLHNIIGEAPFSFNTIWKSIMVETLIIVIATMLIIPFRLTTHLSSIFRVIKTSLSILNPKYLIIGIVITLTPTLLSTNTPRNTDPLHCTLMIGS